MNIHLKQRLVGALVLIAVAAVFLPMLFEAPKKILLDRQSQISQPSPFKKFQLVEPASRTAKSGHQESQIEQAKVAPNAVKSTPAEKTPKSSVKQSRKSENHAAKVSSSQPEKPRLDKQGLPVAWVIQVASFAKKDNALKLKDELRAKNFSAYIKSIETSRGPAVRVFVGPKLDKKRAEQVKQRLDKEFQLNTLIVRFEM